MRALTIVSAFRLFWCMAMVSLEWRSWAMSRAWPSVEKNIASAPGGRSACIGRWCRGNRGLMIDRYSGATRPWFATPACTLRGADINASAGRWCASTGHRRSGRWFRVAINVYHELHVLPPLRIKAIPSINELMRFLSNEDTDRLIPASPHIQPIITMLALQGPRTQPVVQMS